MTTAPGARPRPPDPGTAPTVNWEDIPAPLVVLVVAGVLALVLRWVFRPSRPRPRPPIDAEMADLGLLTVVATGLSRSDAQTQRDLLAAAGLRASVSHRHDGLLDLLVFTDDAERARTVLRTGRS